MLQSFDKSRHGRPEVPGAHSPKEYGRLKTQLSVVVAQQLYYHGRRGPSFRDAELLQSLCDLETHTRFWIPKSLNKHPDGGLCLRAAPLGEGQSSGQADILPWAL